MNARLFVPAALAAAVLVGCGGGSEPASQPRSECERSQLRITSATNHRTYEPGEIVVVTSSVTNRSAQPCQYAGSTFEYMAERASGQGLGGGAMHADSFEMVTLAPGETLTNSGQWDQRDCTAGPARCGTPAPGSYVVKVTWTLGKLTVEDTARFEVAEKGR